MDLVSGREDTVRGTAAAGDIELGVIVAAETLRVLEGIASSVEWRRSSSCRGCCSTCCGGVGAADGMTREEMTGEGGETGDRYGIDGMAMGEMGEGGEKKSAGEGEIDRS